MGNQQNNTNSQIVIVIMGPPGSGKGTQAQSLASKYNLFYFSTGELMRQEVRKATPMGKKIADFFTSHKGELLPEDLVETFVKDKLTNITTSCGIIFDGYPRTIKQAKDLEIILKSALARRDREKKLPLPIIINLQVSKASLKERILLRRTCEKCGKIFYPPKSLQLQKCDCGGNLIKRPDDQPEIIDRRIIEYQKETKPLIDYYKEKIININGEPSIKQVRDDIYKKLDQLYSDNDL
jgi:adenylate kinase